MTTDFLLPGHAVLVIDNPPQRVRSLVLAGFAVIAIFVVGFGTWATIAPIGSAAIAPGFIEVESTRKTVQHLEGGIVAAVLVKDGQRVEAGQTLVELDQTRAQASLATLESQRWDALAREARILAERANVGEIAFPAILRERAGDPAIVQIMAGQTQILVSHRLFLQSKSGMVQQKNDRSREEIKGLRAQENSLRHQLGFIAEEQAGVQQLLDKGLERRPRILQLQRERADLEGKLGDVGAQIARSSQTLAETELEVLNLRQERESQQSEELRETQNKLVELNDQIRTASDLLGRTTVRAPVSGLVTDLKLHTHGGVVQPGEALMDIVPSEDRLIVSAQLRPDDIDAVHVGLGAEVHLPAYKQRRTKSLTGTVISISADRLTDKRTDQPYYATRIQIDPASLAESPEIKLVPGMQAESSIQTGKTTVALYALSPVFDTFRRAFRDR
jgi:HlyD family secretion protein